MGGGEDSGEQWLRWLWEHASIFLLRPLLAILFVLSLIALSWFVAWKTVLVHVPLVQEICGLRKKPVKPKPTNLHRISRFYHSNPSRSLLKRQWENETSLLRLNVQPSCGQIKRLMFSLQRKLKKGGDQ